MDDQSRKNPKDSVGVNDLPPKKLGGDVEENVKGGAEPISGGKIPKPASPINDGR